MRLRAARVLRCGRRALSTAATTAEPAERGWFKPTMAAMSTAGAAAAGATYALAAKTVDDDEFRTWLRRDYTSVARWIEDDVLVNYAPTSWALQIRIQDDCPGEAALARVLPDWPNPGAFPTPSSEMTEIGRQCFWRLNPTALRKSATEVASAPGQSSPSAGVVPSPIAGMPSSMPRLEPIAANDEEESHESVEEEDDSKWTSPNLEDLVSAWTTGVPPADPAILHVPEASAARYGAALRAYAGEQMANESVGGIVTGGSRVIRLPRLLRDDDGEGGGGGGSGGSADLERGLQRLRASGAYINAELAALDVSSAALSKRAARGEGGGTALSRVKERCASPLSSPPRACSAPAGDLPGDRPGALLDLSPRPALPPRPLLL